MKSTIDRESLESCLTEIRGSARPFYVYVMSKPDGTPFYVGIGAVRPGRVQRLQIHEREAARPESPRGNKHKRNTIRQIWAAGGTVTYRIDSWHWWDFEARERETLLIQEIGRADLGKGPLTNWTAGGNGLNVPTDEHRRRLSERMRRLHADPAFIAKRNANIARVNRDPLLSAKRDAATREENKKLENRRRIAANLKKMNSPEAIEVAAARFRRLNADPAFQEAQRIRSRAAMLKNHSDPEFWRKHAIANAKRARRSRSSGGLL